MLSTTLLSLFTGISAATAGANHILEVGPLEADARNVLMEVVLPRGAEGEVPRLTEDGAATPCQLVPQADAKMVTVAWLAPRLDRGKTYRWKLSWEKKDPDESPSLIAVSISKGEGGYPEVKIGEALFTRYVFGGVEYKPYLYPVRVDERDMTRHFPMQREVKGERADHPHHRSVWFTHGDVNGVDFWSERSGSGRIVHQSFEEMSGGEIFGVLRTRSEWRARDGEKFLDDERRYRFFQGSQGARVIDFKVTLTASGTEDATFGDTKEGSFGIRVAGTMKETSGGTLINSSGLIGEKAAWGKPAEWVDYSGLVGDRPYGVAVLDHPSSFRHPTHWHIRGYGLLAANPFGYRDFYRGKGKDGRHVLKKGESITFSYRVIFHRGNHETAALEECYQGFANPPEVTVVTAEDDKKPGQE